MEIFDLLSSNYGWKTEYILSRSILEINWRIKTIFDRLNKERSFDMAIHGIRSDSEDQEETNSSQKFDENQKEALRIAREQAFKRKRLEFSNKDSNGRSADNKNQR